MKLARATSRCECQARLVAEVTETGTVVRGMASAGGSEQLAPATTVSRGAAQLDVGWLCPFCGRNTLRSFAVASLVFADAS